MGLCVAGGAVLRYEIQLKNKIDSELNNNDENTVGTIERPNQDKQGKNWVVKNLIIACDSCLGCPRGSF